MATMLVLCDLAGGCVASDGSLQPKGTALNRIVADPDFPPGPGLKLATDDGRAIYTSPPQSTVPAQVANADARRVMQQQFTTTGSSFYSVVQTYLQQQVTATASLPDNDATKIAALGAWTQWDMGNFFNLADPLVQGMAQVITAAGGVVDLDALFVEASRL